MLINLRTNRVPVPFMGGKILARGAMTETLYRLEDDLDRMTAIDFFGGSGLLSNGALRLESSTWYGTTLTTIKVASATT